MRKAPSLKSIESLAVIGIIFGLLLALLVSVNFYFMWAEISTGEKNGALINISGRQRMLLKSTALYSLQLVSSKDREDQNRLRDKLHQEIDLMERIHAELINPKQGNLLKEAESLYFGPPHFLDKQLGNYIEEVRALLSDSVKDFSVDNPHFVNILMAAQSELPKILDLLVEQYQTEKKSEWLNFRMSQKVILVVTLVVLIIMALYVFAPLVKHLRKETDKLRESEERLANAQSIALLGNWEYNLIDNRLQWSDEIYRIFGLNPEKTDLSYETFINCIHPDDREILEKEVGNHLSDRSDYRVIRPDGDIRYIHEKVRVEKDDYGVVTRMWGTAQDITERKKMENSLIEFKNHLEIMIKERTTDLSSANTRLHKEAVERTKSEEKFRSLFNNASDAIFIHDWKWNILEVNDVACHQLGYSRDELLKLKPQDFSLPEQAEKMAENIEALHNTGHIIIETNHVTRKKEVIPVEISARSIQYGEHSAILSIVRDITARKRAEGELRKLSSAVKQSPASIVITDIEGNIEYVNPKFTKTTGYTYEEAIGQNPRILKSGEQSPELYKNLWDTITSGKEWSGAFHNKKKNGELFWESVSISPVVDEDGVITNFLAVKEDITDRKRAEEALRVSKEKYVLAMDVSSDGIWDRNLVTGETYYSPRWKEMLGYHDDDIPNSYYEWTKRLHPDDRERVFKNLKDHREGKTKLYMNEYRLRHKDGSYRWVMAKGAIIKDENGRPARFVGSHADITERKAMEEHLLKTQKLESVGVLAGGIAHDFNNILTAIVNNVHFAKECVVENVNVDEIVELLESANDACFRAKDLTKQLLIFSKGGAPVLKTVSIVELLKVTAEFSLRGTNVKAVCDIQNDLWSVNADEGQINQVINNLLINAQQAMPDGGIIEVGAENLHVSHTDDLLLEEGKYVILAFKDNGKGMSGEIINKIFDPYFSTKEQGSGLGLSTSYSIINNHKGYLEVASEEGKGSTFYIYLPASQNTIEARGRETKSPTKCEGRILVLEDDEAIIKTLRYILNKSGFEAEYSMDGAEAIQIYKETMNSEKRFDAVMLDLTIPGGMGGKECIERLKSIDPNIKGIVCSGYSDDPVIANHEKYGFCDVISKPYQIYEIREKLTKAINA